MDITFGDGKFVTVGYLGSSGIIYTSSNGISWSERNSGTSNHLNGVTYSE